MEMMKGYKKYWCKSGKMGKNTIIIEVFYCDDGLFRVFENRKRPALVFISAEDIKNKFPFFNIEMEKGDVLIEEEDFKSWIA